MFMVRIQKNLTIESAKVNIFGTTTSKLNVEACDVYVVLLKIIFKGNMNIWNFIVSISTKEAYDCLISLTDDQLSASLLYHGMKKGDAVGRG